MLSIRHALPLICAAALISCADGAGPVGPSPSASLLPELETEFLPGIPLLDPFAEPINGEGVIESARGSGHVTFNLARRTFAFTAKNKSDGTTQGQFQLNNRAEGFFKEHGEVTCLLVLDNEAWISGIVRNSDGPTLEEVRLWRVIDNGEGSNDPRDMITLAQRFPPGTDPLICKTPEALVVPPQPIEEGNIQVTGIAGDPI